MKKVYYLLFFFLSSCVSYKLQNKTTQNAKFEIVAKGISANEFMTLVNKVNKNFKGDFDNNKIQNFYNPDSLKKVGDFNYLFTVKPMQLFYVTNTFLYYKNHVKKVIDTAGYLVLYEINEKNEKKLVYESSNDKNLNLFSKKKGGLGIVMTYIYSIE